MNCVVCKVGNIVKDKRTTLKFEKNGRILLIKDVQADVCDTCGEAYLDKETTAKVMSKVRLSLQNDVELEILTMSAA